MPNFLSADALGRALTLRERLACRATSSRPAPAGVEPAAEDRLNRWRASEPFQEAGWWDARLVADGIDEVELRRLLTEPPADAVTRLTRLPQWYEDVVAAYRRPDQPAGYPGMDQAECDFLPLVAPLLAHGRERLTAGLRELSWPGQIDPGLVTDALYRGLPGLLDRMVSRTVIFEINAARLAGQLAGATPAERFTAYVDQLGKPAAQQAMFERYPVLARQLAVAVRSWVAAAVEFASRLAADHPDLMAAFSPSDDPGPLVEVDTGLGDRHRRGRTVAALTWASGLRIGYKPRSVAVDTCLQRLLAWLNARGVSHPFRQLEYLDRGEYGWVEWVPAEPGTDPAALHRFYHRHGGLIAVLHVLRANDFHAENVIAAGDQPVLVDLESLVQPRLPQEGLTISAAERRAAELTSDSVLRIGLLPFQTWQLRGRAVDLSGLGHRPGQRMPLGVPTIEDYRSDTMRVRLDHPPLGNPSHRPVPDAEPLRLLDYAADITAGFVEVYDLLVRHRGELLAEGGPLPAFADAQVRVVPRDTLLYATVRQTGFHPELLRDALRREEHFDCLWRTVPRQPVLARLVAAERRDLWDNDVPVFHTRGGGRVLHDSTGTPVPGVELKPGTERMREAVEELGAADRDRQLWLVRGSLATTVLHASQVASVPRYQLRESDQPVPPDRLVSAASAVGDQLAKVAVDVDDHAQWLGVSSGGGRNWTLGPLGPELFNGLSGVALFLAQLGASTGDPRYTGLSRRAVAAAVGQIERSGLRSHGMVGLPGVVWVLCQLSRLWGEEEPLDLAEEYARQLLATRPDDHSHDVVAGAAGSILALRALERLRPAGVARPLIHRCADQLAASVRTFPGGSGWLSEPLEEAGIARAPLAGLAHGQAGVAWAGLAAAALTGNDQHLTTWYAALEYERSRFDRVCGGWRDMREDADPDAPLAWCHGAPGIGLARIESAPFLDGPTVRAEVEAAVTLTLRKGFGASHCLCHGDIGNLELLLHAAPALDRPDLSVRASKLMHGILDSIQEHSWICGVSLGVPTPGLLIGLAGVGYGMLRMAAPDEVPSVLTLAPEPGWSAVALPAGRVPGPAPGCRD